jgi:hypothetical protein
VLDAGSEERATCEEVDRDAEKKSEAGEMRPYVHGLVVDLEAALKTVPKRAAGPEITSLANEILENVGCEGVPGITTRRVDSPIAS